MKILTMLLLLSSGAYAQLTAPLDTVVTMPLAEARGIVRGIQFLQADTAKKAQIIEAQDKLIGSINREMALAEQDKRARQRIMDEQAEQLRLLRSNVNYYKQALKDSEPGFLEHWYVQISIGLAIGGFVAYKILN